MDDSFNVNGLWCISHILIAYYIYCISNPTKCQHSINPRSFPRKIAKPDLLTNQTWIVKDRKTCISDDPTWVAITVRHKVDVCINSGYYSSSRILADLEITEQNRYFHSH